MNATKTLAVGSVEHHRMDMGFGGLDVSYVTTGGALEPAVAEEMLAFLGLVERRIKRLASHEPTMIGGTVAEADRPQAVPITEGPVSKGGQNPATIGTGRSPAPKGSGGGRRTRRR